MNILPSISPLLVGVTLLFAAAPVSPSYKLETYDVGTGGSSGSTSSTYRSSAISGDQGQGTGSTSTTYRAGTGLIPIQQANVPAAPAITNPANYYNKLHIVIDNGGNPADATFAIAISPDAFSPTTNYVQSDQTVGATLGSEDWQTYTTWGGASGFDVIGLLPSTTYTIKVKAEHGDFTESIYSATANASTIGPSLTFDIDVSASDTETSPPYSITFGSLTAGSVVDSPSKVWIDLDTNAASGGTVFIVSQNTGLNSAAATHTIGSTTGNLAALNEGFGAQNASATQSSGGPLTAQSPYTGTAQNVGITDTTLRQFYVSSNPIVAGRGSLLLKARSAADTPAATDYTDILTLIASASF